MRRSAAIAICWLIWCGGFWRTAPTRPSSRSPPIRACRSPKFCAGRRAGSRRPRDARNQKSRCRAISIGRSGKIRPASNSANAQASTRCSREVRDGTTASATAAPLIDGVALRRHRAQPSTSPIDGGIDRHGRARATTRLRRSAMAAAAAGFPGLGGDACRGTRRRAGARRRSARTQSRPAARLLQNEGGKTLDDALAEVREAVDYCRYYAAQARTTSGAAAACRARPARAMSCAIAAAASSSASARGIFRWRSFSARSRAALVAGNAVVAKPAEQTPLDCRARGRAAA